MTEGQLPKEAPKPGQAQPPAEAPVVSILEMEKYKGKSSEELAKMHQELEKKMGEQSAEVGAVRKEIDEIKQAFNYLTQGMSGNPPAENQSQIQTQEQVSESQPTVQFNWDNPQKTVEQIVSKQLKEELGKFYGVFTTELAQSNYIAGMEQAMTQRPDLFSGVENEVKQVLFQAYKNGRLDARSLRDPETWFTTAWAVRGKKAGFKVENPSGTPPVPGEMPRQGGTPPAEETTIKIAREDAHLDTDKFLDFFKKKGVVKDDEEVARLLKGEK